MKILIIRHGTTLWNVEHRIQGASDIPLDEAGEKIARITGQGLLAQGIRFSHVFSSPLARAYRTAQLVSAGAKISTDPRLTELGFGSFEGQCVEEMRKDPDCPFRYFKTAPQKYNDILLLLEKQQPQKRYESLSSLLKRAGQFMREVVEPLVLTEPADSNVLIAGHGALNKALMMYIQDNHDFSSFWGKGLQANCGIYIIEASRSVEGKVAYRTTEECITFYDPEIIQGAGSLLG